MADATSGRVSIETRASPLSLAMSRAAGTPLPDTSPSRTASLPSRQRDEVVVVAAHGARGRVVGEELVTRQDRERLWQEAALDLGRRAILFFELLLIENRLVHAGVFECDGCLGRHAHQQLQIVLRKLLGAVLAVQLDDPQRLAILGGQGHAHDRANLELGN